MGTKWMLHSSPRTVDDSRCQFNPVPRQMVSLRGSMQIIKNPRYIIQKNTKLSTF